MLARLPGRDTDRLRRGILRTLPPVGPSPSFLSRGNLHPFPPADRPAGPDACSLAQHPPRVVGMLPWMPSRISRLPTQPAAFLPGRTVFLQNTVF
jgi:hypothetical protein